MYLSHIKAINFRIFGDKEDSLNLNLSPGLNMIVGENDCGKSAVMDAIRYVLGTTSQEYIRFQETDFYHSAKYNKKATQFRITLKFEDIKIEEGHRFIEHLTHENGKDVLYVTLVVDQIKGQKGSWIIKSAKRRSGIDGNGLEIDGEIRATLYCTFLKPLRDAENELAPGKNSRLSQILLSHGDLDDHKEDLITIIDETEKKLKNHPYLKSTGKTINDSYLERISLLHHMLKSRIALVGQDADDDHHLKQLFEKLELFLSHTGSYEVRTRHGLGANNLLFIAAELLLLKNNSEESNPLLLIEEPEAHIHPQAQMQLLDFLLDESCQDHDSEIPDKKLEKPIDEEQELSKPQIIITTHSPNLASKVLIENLILMVDGKTYPLRRNETKLEKNDYDFLRIFLDATKANLFFARGVLIVEGDAENILLPTIARLIGMPLERHGISIVNVGHVGLFRYAKIFQRTDKDSQLPVNVACLSDRDLRPDIVGYDAEPRDECQYVKRTSKNMRYFENFYTDEKIGEYINKKRINDGQNVLTFVSPKWTFEYDLAFGNQGTNENLCLEVYQAARLTCKTHRSQLSDSEIEKIKSDAMLEYQSWVAKGYDIEKLAALAYKDFFKKSKQCSKARAAYYLAQILEGKYRKNQEDFIKKVPAYIVEAIKFVCQTRRETLSKD